jgi:hypothetical protein
VSAQVIDAEALEHAAWLVRVGSYGLARGSPQWLVILTPEARDIAQQCALDDGGVVSALLDQ